MEDKFEIFLSCCFEIDFGTVKLSERQKNFCSELSNEVVSLCESLPKSTQADALLLLMKYFQIPFGQELSFFMNYYAPAWSIIYWLIESGRESGGLEEEDIKNAKTAHSMALLLHPIDDHLNDNEWPASHLALLLRSQLWLTMSNAMNSLADEVDGGEKIMTDFLDDYYSSIRDAKEILSLDNYCDLFRKQMATGYISPALIMKKMGTNEECDHAIRAAYGSFGVAWRLLDDINDIQTDMMTASKSAVYSCLPTNIRDHWNKCGKEAFDEQSVHAKAILVYIQENGTIEKIKERICNELDSAADTADDYNMTGLADEFRCLLEPLKIDLN
jgi:hypothetical protein